MRGKYRVASSSESQIERLPAPHKFEINRRRCPDRQVIELLTIIPLTLTAQHPMSLFAYLIRPLRMYGQPTFATSAGKILQNAMMPLGVDGGTRSRAADRIIT